MKEYHGSR